MPSEISAVEDCQCLLRNRLSGKQVPGEIFGYEKERAQLLDVIKRTAELGESNSLLIIGPRGSGKSMILKSVYEELLQIKVVKESLMLVLLNGLLQTDDRIALKEITRQLKLENTVGDKVFGTFAENLQFLLDALKSGDQKSKPILFVLDEFDLFAHHKNQTLLYNLFDVAQSAQAPICVVGLTTRLDVMELLEKRVKSRFSHRQLHLLPGLSFNEYIQMFISYLSLPANFKHKKYAKEWNKNLQVLTKDGMVQDVLRKQFNLDKDVRALHRIMWLPVCKLNERKLYLETADFVESGKLLFTDSKAAMLHEYQKFAKRSSMKMFEKAVVLKAFEHICALELVRLTDGAGSRTQKEYRPMALLMTQTQIMEALERYPSCPTEVKQWASSSLVTH